MAKELQMRNIVPLYSEGNWIVGIEILIDGEHKLDVGGDFVREKMALVQDPFYDVVFLVGLHLVFLLAVSGFSNVEFQRIPDVQSGLVDIVIQLVAKFAIFELIGQIFLKEDHIVAEQESIEEIDAVDKTLGVFPPDDLNQEYLNNSLQVLELIANLNNSSFFNDPFYLVEIEETVRLLVVGLDHPSNLSGVLELVIIIQETILEFEICDDFLDKLLSKGLVI